MEEIFGLKEILDYKLYLRGIIVTLYAIVIFRVNLSRVYGNHSPLDFIIYIILGAILGEAIVNNIPLFPSLIVCTLIILLYRFLVYLSYISHGVGKYVKGDKITIIKDGKYLDSHMQCSRITPHDVLQALRLQYGINTIKSVKLGILERGGQISFQLKQNSTEKSNMDP